MRRLFNSVAAGWDVRAQRDSLDYLMPPQAALDRHPASSSRLLDIGTGTGAAAIHLADRYPYAQTVGIDVSDDIIAQARARATSPSSRVRFVVADIAGFENDMGFDLITMLNMPTLRRHRPAGPRRCLAAGANEERPAGGWLTD